MWKSLRLIMRYLKYLTKAKSKYHIHSPFVFELITRVIENEFAYPEYLKAEATRQEMLNNHSSIEVVDFGAKSGNKSYTSSFKKISEIAKNSAIAPKYGQLLYRLVKHFEPQTILEIGTSLGISTIYQALASPQSKLFCIEGCANTAEKAQENFNKLRLNNIELNIGNFDSLLPVILKKIKTIDFAFIDGNHRKEPTINYFEQCLPLTTNNSVLIFDDIHWSEGMEEAWNHIIANSKVTLSIDLFFMGIIFFKKELCKQDFIIRH